MSSINRPIYLQYNYTIKPQKKQGLSANFLAKKHTLRTVLLNTSGKVGDGGILLAAPSVFVQVACAISFVIE